MSFCCACTGSCNHVGPHSFCAAHGGVNVPTITTDSTAPKPSGWAEGYGAGQADGYHKGYDAGYEDAVRQIRLATHALKRGGGSQEPPA